MKSAAICGLVNKIGHHSSPTWPRTFSKSTMYSERLQPPRSYINSIKSASQNATNHSPGTSSRDRPSNHIGHVWCSNPIMTLGDRFNVTCCLSVDPLQTSQSMSHSHQSHAPVSLARLGHISCTLDFSCAADHVLRRLFHAFYSRIHVYYRLSCNYPVACCRDNDVRTWERVKPSWQIG